MATAVQDKRRPKGDRWLVRFKYRGRAFKYSVGPLGRKSAEKVAREAKDRVETRLAMLRDGHITMPPDIAYEDVGRWVYGDARVTSPVPEEENNGGTIEQLVKDYLESRYLMVTLREKTGMREGGLSRGSYSSDHYRLQNFLKHCKNCSKTKVSSVVTADFLRDYRTKILSAIARGSQSDADGKHHLRTVKALLVWSFEQEKIGPPPRNLLSKSFAKVDIQAPSPEFFTLDQVRSLFNSANDRMRLFVTLGLNCGYTQADIASLTHDMVDFDGGYIRRDRQKTGVQSEHKLWTVTLDLLKRFATDPKTHTPVLLNSHGRVLYEETKKDDGRVTKKDTIGAAFAKLRDKLELPLSFKHFRKTGANLIEKQYQEYPHLAKLYLSHETQGTQKHYTGRSADLLHAATSWLEGYFDLKLGGTLDGSGGLNSQ